MKRMKNKFKKMISTFLSAVIAFTSLGLGSLTGNVSAASWTLGSSAVINVDSYPFGYNFEGSGLRYPEGGLVGMWATCIPKLSVDGQVAYCIDSRATQGPNGQSNGTVDDSYADDHRISLALAYGYTGSTKYGYSSDTERLATQIVIWNIMDGWYDNDSEATALYYFTAQMGDSTLIANVKTVYYKIKDNIKSYNTKPSFSGNSGNMEYSSSTKKWTYKFTDTKNVARTQNGQNCFEHSGTNQNGDQRREGPGHIVQDVHTHFLGRELLLGLASFIIRRGGGLETAHRHHFFIHLRDILPDDDLVLSARPGHTQDAAHFLDAVIVRDAVIFQVKAEPGHTVGYMGHVFFAADRF